MNSSDIEQLVRQAVGLIDTGKFAAARKMLLEILRIDENRAEVWLLIARLNQNTGNRKAAADAFREVLKLDPDSEDATINLVNYLGSEEEFDECETILRNAINRRPSVARYQFMLSKTLVHKGYHAKAVKHAELALAATPGNPQLIVGLAEIHGRHGNADAALNLIQPLLEMDPPLFPAVMVFANICTALNMTEDCRILLEKLSRTRLNPEQARQFQNVREMLSNSGI